MFTGKLPVPRFLLAVWILILAWQALEHRRVTNSAREISVQRARDISRTLELVIRAQRWGAVVLKPRLEAALHLLKTNDLKQISLLNQAWEVVAGDPLEVEGKGYSHSFVRWDKHTVTVINLVNLGDVLTSSPTIVVQGDPREDGHRGDRIRFPPPPPERERGHEGPDGPSPEPPRLATNAAASSPAAATNRNERLAPGAGDPTNPVASVTARAPGGPGAADRPGGLTNRPPRRWGFGRPPWMSEEEFKQKGLHALAIVLSADAYHATRLEDLSLRSIILAFASLAMVGIGFAWRNLAKTGELEIRLVRASEMNSHLREMNVAAAGLAHETRNPLNLIRGLAQIISKDTAANEHVRDKAVEIIDEVDYVTVRLNEFINYSRPREVRRAPVDIASAVNDVVRSLNSDVEDKRIHLELQLESFLANADQQMLRQILFNLLLNAIQAVEPDGHIRIVARRDTNKEGAIEIRDDGPGVQPEHRQEIFRPYFTTRKDGTGLGLAVVKQIVQLHGWEVEFSPNGDRGSVFRVSRIEVVGPTAA